MKRQTTAWEIIFVEDIPNKGTVIKICKELLKLNNKKITQLKHGQEALADPYQRRYIGRN